MSTIPNPPDLSDEELLPIESDEAPADNAKSLDDAISSALEGMDEAEAEASDRARDEKGRFKAADRSEAAAAPADGTSAEPHVPRTEPATLDAKPDDASEGQFRGWSPEQRAQFNALPPEAQRTVLEVVKGRDQFYGEKIAAYDRSVEAIRPLVTAVQPHVDRIRSANVDPSAYVAHVLNLDYKLQYAPYAEKVQLFNELARSIGVPVSVQSPDPFVADPTTIGGEAYPVIHDLKNQVTTLQSQLHQYQRQQEHARQQQTQSYIASFASSHNADGSPRYPLFEQVRGAMGQLLETGQATTMEDAYALAVKPIEAAISQRIAAQTKATQAASQAALDKARKARPVKTTGMAPGGQTKGGGLDGILDTALSAAGYS